MKSYLIKKRIALIFLGLVTFLLINGEVSYAQWLSPGKLTKSHKELEGLKNCTKCHELGKGIVNTACMSCHEKLVAQIKNNKGFHSKLKDPCISCHTDHKGENYNIISLDKDKFDHDTTDYKLKDKHKTSCEKCHREKKTFLGLTPECIGCHTDIHKKQLAGDCTQCHNFQEWEKANFDHAKSSKYRITGKHKDVKCDQCHKGSAMESEGKPGDIKKEYNALNFKPLNHDKCNDCHFDIHKGELKKQTCKDCHTTDGWEKKTFEHNNPALSDFRLEGKHEKVACELCHIEETFRYKQNGKTVERVARRLTSVKHEKCNDCHYDVHTEQFRDQRCDSCHTVENEWKKPEFSHDSKEYKGFKLEGRHKEVECKLCHEQQELKYKEFKKKKKTTLGKFKPLKSEKCNDCHYDVHTEQFRDQRCDSCHTVENEWKKPEFRHDSNEYKGFKLEGRHKEVECKLCHEQKELKYKEFKKKKKTTLGIFKPLKSEKCNDCHYDVHKEQFRDQRCDSCHTVEKEWKKFGFSHESVEYTGYKLEGRHTEVECKKCHKQSEVTYVEFGKNKDSLIGQFKPTEHNTCSVCHEDKHKGQYTEACSNCHSPANWEPKKYLHDPISLELKGAHRTLECIECHQGMKNFDELDSECVSCHQHQDPHINQFGPFCDDCHRQQAWIPTDFKHTSVGFRLAGVHREADCMDCHINRDYRNTSTDCVDCHTEDYQSAPNHLARQYPQQCDKCHKASAVWASVSYDHTAFTFMGAHNALRNECSTCHDAPVQMPAGTTDGECYNCHASSGVADTSYEGAPAPSHTVFNFSTTCTDCHTVNAWAGANYTHQSLQLNGLHTTLDCASCHASGYPGNYAGASQGDCITCHQSDYNGALNHTNFNYPQDCTTCHSGNSWEGAIFQHQNFQRNGLHASLDCTECHANGYPGDYAGATQGDCIICHQSDYDGASNHTNFNYPQDCTNCHSGNSWTGASYSHQSLNLNSLHSALTCTDCHASGYPGDYAGSSQGDCITCHQSDYDGALNHTNFNYPQDCTNCHSGNTWLNASFNHQSLNLNSLHSALACTDCHASGYPGDYAGASQGDCIICHQSDYDGAQNHTNFNYPQDCSNCHSGNSWLNASFSHQNLNLNSLHSALDCTDCHASGYPGNYAGASQGDCITCHQSDYNGALNHTNFSYPQDCTTCHSGNSWSGASYSHQSFQLSGVHTSLDCIACHASGYPGDYAGATQGDCITCHQSDYNGALNHTNFSYPQDCTTCHSGNTWLGASFTHQSLNLNSLHSTLDCIACHANGYPGDYAGATQGDCYTCHVSDYNGALNHQSFNYPQDCTTCHSGNTWLNASFTHQSLNLNSLHSTLDCIACHANGYPGDYAGATQGDCYTCHVSDYNGALNHQSFNYPQDCTTCHSGNTWLGASYSHQSFQLSGVHTTLDCIACHANGYPGDYAGATQGDCYTCHVSDYNGALNHTNFSYPQDCTTCHSGNTWLGASFTHQSLNLNSLHSTLDCIACHANGYPGDYAGATQGDCYTCHVSDYNGALNHTNFSYPQDCTTCHSGNTWLNASFTHQSLNLNSLHSTLDCIACHANGYPGDYAGATQGDCYTCHVSDYNGALNHQSFNYPQDCTTCHSGNTWLGASYSHQSLNLNSLHSALDCIACHANGYPGDYAGATQGDCYTCHVSDYNGALNHTNFSYPQDCTTCHSGNTWLNASFTHQSLNLNSLHSTLDCIACHANGYPGDYAGASQSDCYTCHQSDYNGATNHQNFNYPQDCTNCHSGNSWSGASFQHQSFQLRGIHANLSCNECHSSGYPGNYSGTSDDDCFACHESDYNSEHRNNPHDCTQCHDLWDWGNAD